MVISYEVDGELGGRRVRQAGGGQAVEKLESRVTRRKLHALYDGSGSCTAFTDSCSARLIPYDGFSKIKLWPSVGISPTLGHAVKST